jgi:tRNA(adenine34) deaminase
MGSMTQTDFMKEALLEAEKAFEEGEVPVGAVVVVDDVIVGRGHNLREREKDISSHAEIEAIRQAEGKLGKWALDGASIYVTLEPCLMCAGAILQARIQNVIFAVSDPDMGAVVSHYYVYDDPTSSFRPLCHKGLLESESRSLLQAFFKSKRVH